MSLFVPMTLQTCLRTLTEVVTTTRPTASSLVYEYTSLHPVLSPSYVLSTSHHGRDALASLVELIGFTGDFDGSIGSTATPSVVVPMERHDEPGSTAIVRGDTMCCICYDDYSGSDSVSRLRCTHAFHAACVDEWLRYNSMCPLCRATSTATA